MTDFKPGDRVRLRGPGDQHLGRVQALGRAVEGPGILVRVSWETGGQSDVHPDQLEEVLSPFVHVFGRKWVDLRAVVAIAPTSYIRDDPEGNPHGVALTCQMMDKPIFVEMYDTTDWKTERPNAAQCLDRYRELLEIWRSIRGGEA